MFRRLVLSIAVVLFVAIMLQAGPSVRSPEGRTGSSRYPWDYQGYHGYIEPPSNPAHYGPWGQPEKYQAYVTRLPEDQKADPTSATVVAHVPESAAIWFNDQITNASGTLREFHTPSLVEPRRFTYTYTARIAWVENGRMVSQLQTFNVAPGGVYCVYLMQTKAKLEPKTELKENLAKLNAEDQALAEKQQFCAVQEGIKLGAMGVPVKTSIKGQPVFLCCDACTARAMNNPEKTLAKVKELQAMPAIPANK